VVAFNWNDMDALARLCAEDVVNVAFEGWPDEPVYHGRDGIKRVASSWWEYFSGTHMKIERLIEQGDRVVVLITHTGVAEGVEVEQSLGGIIDFRDGLMCRLRWFLAFDQALAAAGLTEAGEAG
jgi:ketosteroid isomerase-like protein